MKHRTLLFLLSLLFFQVQAQATLPTVEKVDLQSYLGKWYEVARYDQWFQRDCYRSTAEYQLRKDNEIRVINRCHKDSPNGKVKTAIGRAWVIDQSSNAKLKVQFFLRFLRLPFLSGDYWVIDLGENYEYSVVSEPSKKYLWILSRTPQMDPVVYQKIMDKLTRLGFDISQLIKR